MDIRARLFDADEEDREVELDDKVLKGIGERQLLWVDVSGSRDKAGLAGLADLAEQFAFRPETTAWLTSDRTEPGLALHGDYFQVRASTVISHASREEVRWLDLVTRRNIVITIHDDKIDFLTKIDTEMETDARIGLLSAPLFVAALLDGLVTSYFEAVDDLELRVDELDAAALAGEGSRDILVDLVTLRRRTGALRRIISAHRPVFASLAWADFDRLAETDAAGHFQLVADRYERAVTAAENSREILIGSFEIHMTRTAQRTNDVMKALTLVSVLLLPGALLAGLMGMNVPVPLNKDDPAAFWFVVALILVTALITLAVARLRRWI